jgi:hypothetical protein
MMLMRPLTPSAAPAAAHAVQAQYVLSQKLSEIFFASRQAQFSTMRALYAAAS